MKLFTRKQLKFIDRLLFTLPVIQQTVTELRIRKISDAEQSGDPTADTALAGMGLEDMEQWMQVMLQTCDISSLAELEQGKSQAKYIRSRWILKKEPEETCEELFISLSTYWKWRKDILLTVALLAKVKNLKF